MEAESDIDENQQQCEAQRPDRTGLELIAYLCAQHVELRHLRGRIERFHGSLDLGTQLSGRLSGLGRQPDDQVTRGTEVLYLGLAETGGGELASYLVDARRVRERRLRAHATREIYAQIRAAGGGRGGGGGHRY